jgi:hypothetical protein
MSGLSAPRILFGVHSISPYNRADKTPYGILKVIGAANMSLSSSIDTLFGGSNKFPWAAEAKNVASSLACKVKAYPGFLFTQFMGASSTDNAGESLASVTALANFKGTSIMNATTGIASVGITSANESNVKFGKYLVVAASSTTVNVYAYSDVDFPRGSTPLSYQTDLLKITASALTISTTGAITVIPNTGLQFVGGSGTIGMTVGDTATFSSRPENSVSSDIIIGKSSTIFPAFGAIFVAQKRSDGEMFEVEAFNVIGSGFPLNLDEYAFSQTELKMECLYDSVQDAVFAIRHVVPLTVT